MHKRVCRRLQETDNIPQLDTVHETYREFDKAFYGDHAPLSQRIRWHSVSENNIKSRKVQDFMNKLDIPLVGTYAVSAASLLSLDMSSVNTENSSLSGREIHECWEGRRTV